MWANSGRSVLVLLLSDGVANVGATTTDEILERIGDRGDSGQLWLGYPDHGLLDASSMSVPPGCKDVGGTGMFGNLLAAGVV